MQPVSARWEPAVRAGFVSIVEADAARGAHVVRLPTVVGGVVVRDRSAKVRGRVDLVLADAVSMVTDPAGILAPLGSEVYVRAGIDYGGGPVEVVPLGVFRVDQAEPRSDGTVQVTGQDRAAHIIDARLEAPYTVPAGTNYATAVYDFVRAGYPDVVFAADPVTATTPLIIVEEQADRWDTALGWAEAIGWELFFNGAGVLRFRPEPSVATTAPLFSIDEGPGGVLVDDAAPWARSGRYNRVIAVGENPAEGAIYRGVWTDDDPASPTRYDGPFGRVPRWYASPLISSDAQAASAAAGIGRRQQGTVLPVTWTMAPNYALEEGDPVTLTRSTGETPVVLIDQLAYPLTVEQSMSGRARATS